MRWQGLLPRAPWMVTLALLLALFGYGAVAYPNFASWGVVRNLLVDNAFLGVAAIGATFVILSGGIDLSVSSVMAFTRSGMACSGLMGVRLPHGGSSGCSWPSPTRLPKRSRSPRQRNQPQLMGRSS